MNLHSAATLFPTFGGGHWMYSRLRHRDHYAIVAAVCVVIMATDNYTISES